MSKKHGLETALLGWKGKIFYKMGIQGTSLLFQRLRGARGIWDQEQR